MKSVNSLFIYCFRYSNDKYSKRELNSMTLIINCCKNLVMYRAKFSHINKRQYVIQSPTVQPPKIYSIHVILLLSEVQIGEYLWITSLVHWLVDYGPSSRFTQIQVLSYLVQRKCALEPVWFETHPPFHIAYSLRYFRIQHLG